MIGCTGRTMPNKSLSDQIVSSQIMAYRNPPSVEEPVDVQVLRIGVGSEAAGASFKWFLKVK